MAASTTVQLVFEVAESRHTAGEFVVEAVGPDGEVYVTIFAGPAAKERALRYAEWQNKS